MNANEIINEIKDAMDFNGEVYLEDSLESFEDWDSLTMLNILSFFHDKNLNIDVEDIEQCQTIGDIVKLAIK